MSFPPFSKRRDVHPNHIQSEIQILAKLSIRNVFFGSHWSRRGCARLRVRCASTETEYSGSCMDVKQFGCKLGRHLPDLVEQQRAFVGKFEFSRLVVELRP